MNPTTEPTPGKPRVALLVATAFGLGYLPKAPGTWGSLGGAALALSPWWLFMLCRRCAVLWSGPADPVLLFEGLLTLITAAVGLWAASRAAEFFGAQDPPKVVIDEVSGQQITLVLGGFWPGIHMAAASFGNRHPLGIGLLAAGPNWKYLLLGLILFRVFDIWKPFPVRQAESLPGGWGIMADDWLAAIYAALGLWLVRALAF
ncbi:MAG TPA: phosphatidylglycerophosphatase A [Candidatus Acidoferrales bacterium]|nr:phosphatidylglycerophosphatase A [Candidatus Acidoferrales bacterium]